MRIIIINVLYVLCHVAGTMQHSHIKRFSKTKTFYFAQTYYELFNHTKTDKLH